MSVFDVVRKRFGVARSRAIVIASSTQRSFSQNDTGNAGTSVLFLPVISNLPAIEVLAFELRKVGISGV